MNEKDRRIVTFGGDDDIASEYENISMDFDIPEETPASSGTYNAPETDSHNDAPQSGYGYEPSQSSYNYEMPQSSIYDAAETAPQQEPAVKQKPLREPRDPRYVTKGALVVCMVLTMLVSTILGAFIGGFFSGGSFSPSGQSSDDNREPRKDSELSHLSLSDATGSEMTVSEIVGDAKSEEFENSTYRISDETWGRKPSQWSHHQKQPPPCRRSCCQYKPRFSLSRSMPRV